MLDQECFKCSLSGASLQTWPPDDMWFCGVTSHFLSDDLYCSMNYDFPTSKQRTFQAEKTQRCFARQYLKHGCT